MKKITLLLAFCFSLLTILKAQTPPDGFNYSAVARDGSGIAVTNQAIALQMSILQSTAIGSIVYQETHNVLTDDYGLFNLVIGAGAVQQGSFSNINWAGDSYYLKIEMDITGGLNYTNMGTTQFLSVPYAMHSKTADSVSNQVFQSLSLSNDTLFLSNGGYVILSQGAGSSGSGPNAPLPSVTTSSVSNISSQSALCGGNITYDGGTAVVERGVCWNTISNPTINDNRTFDFGGGIGSFDINFSGLQVNNTYYVRAFAVNNTGITYGNELSFITTALNGGIGANLLPDNGYCSNDTISISSCNGQTSLTYNGYDYDLVEIGGQCWFKENLQTTSFRNGAPILSIDSAGQQMINCAPSPGGYYTECFTSSYTWPSYDSVVYASDYGALYNKFAVTDPNELCPVGWHVPTDCEWMYLENTLGLTDAEQQATGIRGSNQGGMLKDINYWSSPNTWATDASGFSAKPAGNYTIYNVLIGAGALDPGGAIPNYSSTYLLENSGVFHTSDGYMRVLSNNSGEIIREDDLFYYWSSVRCIKD